MQTTQNIEQLKERKRCLEEKRRETIQMTYDLLKKISDGGKAPEMPTVLKVEKQVTYISEITKFIFTNSNVRKLQEWTGKRFTTVLFDSKDGFWSKGYSHFHQIIHGDKHIVIAILDNKGNMFGGYVSGTFVQQQFCGDQNTFLFKLPSEKNSLMVKYDLKEGVDGNVFYIDDENSTNLFQLGDLTIMKKGNGESRFFQEKFEYMGQNLIDSGDIVFTVERIVVAEMVDL